MNPQLQRDATMFRRCPRLRLAPHGHADLCAKAFSGALLGAHRWRWVSEPHWTLENPRTSFRNLRRRRNRIGPGILPENVHTLATRLGTARKSRAPFIDRFLEETSLAGSTVLRKCLRRWNVWGLGLRVREGCTLA